MLKSRELTWCFSDVITVPPLNTGLISPLTKDTEAMSAPPFRLDSTERLISINPLTLKGHEYPQETFALEETQL